MRITFGQWRSADWTTSRIRKASFSAGITTAMRSGARIGAGEVAWEGFCIGELCQPCLWSRVAGPAAR